MVGTTNLLSDELALGICPAVIFIFISLFFRKFHPPFDVGSVHPQEMTVPVRIGVDRVFVAVHHGDVLAVLGGIFSFFRIPGILHHIPGKGLQESGLGGIMDMIIGHRRHALLRLHVALRKMVDGSVTETVLVDGEIGPFLEDVQDFLSGHISVCFF
jgi:hypothetical protein